jgi:murein DD-endopeptidase MepM/ murein hydrolase activator NlpD
MNDFDPDVREIADQLSRTDFSRESRIRYALKERLLAHRPTRRFSPMVRMATVAAMLMLVIVGAGLILPPTSQVMSATEISLQPTPTARPYVPDAENITLLASPHESTESLVQNAKASFFSPQLQIYLPEDIEGYQIYSIGQEMNDKLQLTAIYYQYDQWREAIARGNPYSEETDWLYFFQREITIEAESFPEDAIMRVGTPDPQTGRLRGSRFIQLNWQTTLKLESYEIIEDGVTITAYGTATLSNRTVSFVAKQEQDYEFWLWSFNRTEEELLTVMESVQPFTVKPTPTAPTTEPQATIDFPFDNCVDLSNMGESPFSGQWMKPIRFGDYPVHPNEDELGVEIDTPLGVGVSAAHDGVVIYSGENKNDYGKMIVMAHKGYFTFYERLSITNLECGDYAGFGQTIGATGDMGFRFAIMDTQGVRIDPITLIDFEADATILFPPAPTITPFTLEASAPGMCAPLEDPNAITLEDKWVSPIESYPMTRRFSANYPGIDINAPEGTSVIAPNNGIVVFAGRSMVGHGLAVVLQHRDRYTLYAHLSEINVGCLATIKQGDVIGTVGNTGDSEQPHLYFELIDVREGNRIDPTTLIAFPPMVVFPTASAEVAAPESTLEVSIPTEHCSAPSSNETIWDEWTMPIFNASIVSPYAPGHFGIDYSARPQTSIFAANNGTVVSIEEDATGTTITLAHGGYFSRYSRVTGVNVTCGDRVISGKKIAEAGNGSFYFQIFDQAMRPVDPATFLDFRVDFKFFPQNYSLVFEADTPGSCPSQSIPWDLGGIAQPPIPIGQFTIVREFTEDHPAMLLGAAEGEAVYAAQEGIVVFAGWSNSGTGQTVILAHGSGYTLYGHLSEITVSCGSDVNKTRTIGKVGATGNTSGPILRFEMMDSDLNRIDPASFIDFVKPR